MDDTTQVFCTMIENRSNENRQAMNCFGDPLSVLSPAFSVLRQELDSMVRVLYLLQMTDFDERTRLIESTLNGEKWQVPTQNGKLRYVTDKDMVDIAQRLHGWAKSVYKFGCAFVHLSDFHNHFAEDPFQKLSIIEKQEILAHMRQYHGGPLHDDPNVGEISVYLPRVFEKVSGNLEYYIRALRNGEIVCD